MFYFAFDDFVQIYLFAFEGVAVAGVALKGGFFLQKYFLLAVPVSSSVWPVFLFDLSSFGGVFVVIGFAQSLVHPSPENLLNLLILFQFGLLHVDDL